MSDEARWRQDEPYVEVTRRAPRRPRTALLTDLLRGVVPGTVLGVPLAVVAGSQGFPDWAETLSVLLFSFGFLVVPALLFRAGLHLLNWYADRGGVDLDPDRRSIDVCVSRWPIAVPTVLVVAWLWLLLAHGLSTGTWTWAP